MFEKDQRKSDSNDYDKDDKDKTHTKRWPIEHITKISSVDLVCLHPLKENVGLSVMFINSCYILST